MYKRIIILGAIFTLAMALYAALLWHKIEQRKVAGGSATGNAISVASMEISSEPLEADQIGWLEPQGVLSPIPQLDSALIHWLQKHNFTPQRWVVLAPWGNENTARTNSWNYPYKNLHNVELQNGDLIVLRAGTYDYPKHTPPLQLDSLWIIGWPLDSVYLQIESDLFAKFANKWRIYGIKPIP